VINLVADLHKEYRLVYVSRTIRMSAKHHEEHHVPYETLSVLETRVSKARHPASAKNFDVLWRVHIDMF
jgi:hypothetical protein